MSWASLAFFSAWSAVPSALRAADSAYLAWFALVSASSLAASRTFVSSAMTAGLPSLMAWFRSAWAPARSACALVAAAVAVSAFWRAAVASVRACSAIPLVSWAFLTSSGSGCGVVVGLGPGFGLVSGLPGMTTTRELSIVVKLYRAMTWVVGTTVTASAACAPAVSGLPLKHFTVGSP